MAKQNVMGASQWGQLLALSVLWGGSFFFIGIAVKELPPLTIVLLRLCLAAVALLAVLRITGLKLPTDRQAWQAFLGMGLLNNLVPFSLIVWGQTHIASSLAAILNATTPLFAVLVAHLLTADEKLTGNKLAGVTVGFIGVAIMIGTDALAGLGDQSSAQLAVLGAALSYALAGIFGRRFKAMGIAPLPSATGQVCASSLLLMPLALLVDRPWTLALPSLPVWAALLGIALLSTALAYVLFFRILASAGATNLMLVTFLIPVSAIVLGALVLGEHLHAKHLLGMSLITLGLVAIDGRLFKRLVRAKDKPVDRESFLGRDI
ncbi:MAG: DMT family transporter [Pseudomonas sp.]|uniref:DMT family transporter n=1 Tax=unclassified Pseudomonas TaxID=196821 RepID=UPI001CFAAA9E|nr:DMT family transporter [Pseudomonas sp. L5B5]UCZ86183.1 DMT family transporter [Pseudomonas sp. L5B5]